MSQKHEKTESQDQKEKIAKLQEFAYRAPSPDSEPPTMKEEGLTEQTEGAERSGRETESEKAKEMEDALRSDRSPDDFPENESAAAESDGRKIA